VLLSTEHLRLKDPDRSKKLLGKYIGPFRVTRVISPVAYELDLPSSMQIHRVFHVSKLRELKQSRRDYPGRESAESERPPPELVKWRGYPEWEMTWEPASHLSNARRAMEEYEAGCRP